MKNDSSYSKFSFVGFFLFLMPIMVIIAVSVFLFELLKQKGVSSVTIAVVMIVDVLVFTAIFTAFDIYRRRKMIDIPVKQILNATEKLSSGNFNVKLTPLHSYDKYDQYDLIMENFNKMASELSRSEMLKNDFIANVSHEIKTPLAIISNYAKALQDKNLDEETKNQYSVSLLNATKRLSSLVSNILKLNKLENQSIAENKQKINLSEMIGECIIAHEELIEKKQLNCNINLDDVQIYSVPSYLEIIWNNLISNAIKFTENGGTIGVELVQDKQFVCVKISDTGIGLSAETGKHIFEKFYQGETSHSSEGNGLGLAMVKKVIDILGGEISVESTLGKGTTFCVKLKKEWNE